MLSGLSWSTLPLSIFFITASVIVSRMLNGGFTVRSSRMIALSPVTLSSSIRTRPAGLSSAFFSTGGASAFEWVNGKVSTIRTGRHSPFDSRCTSDTTSRHSSTPIAIWFPAVTWILSAEIRPADKTEPSLPCLPFDAAVSFANTASLTARPVTLISPFSSNCSFSTVNSLMLARLTL